MRFEGSVKTVILGEIIFPIVLLIFGIYHGLIQALYRAGIIKDMSFLGIEYYQGLTLHGVINAIVFTTMIIVAFGNAVFLYYLKKPLRPATGGSVGQLFADGGRNPYGSLDYVCW